jgi:hypothetical protein
MQFIIIDPSNLPKEIVPFRGMLVRDRHTGTIYLIVEVAGGLRLLNLSTHQTDAVAIGYISTAIFEVMEQVEPLKLRKREGAQ